MKICMKWVVTLGLLIVLGFGPAQAGDYTLEEIYRIGMQQSEKVKISSENVEIANSGTYKALSALLPKATAFGAGTQFTGKRTTATGSVIQPHTQGNWGVRVDETLSLSGREFLSYSQSKDNVEKSRFDLPQLSGGFSPDLIPGLFRVSQGP